MSKDRELIQQAFGKILREYRLKKNISQVKLAELGDFERTYISDLERGLKQPSLHTVIKLSIAFELKPSELIKLLEERIVFN